MTAEKLLEHQGAILLAQSDGCAVWQFRNETGDGTMTTYEVFPGVMLAFNDFHMEHYECDFGPTGGCSPSTTAARGAWITPRATTWSPTRRREICKSSATSAAELLLFATGGRFE